MPVLGNNCKHTRKHIIYNVYVCVYVPIYVYTYLFVKVENSINVKEKNLT